MRSFIFYSLSSLSPLNTILFKCFLIFISLSLKYCSLLFLNSAKLFEEPIFLLKLRKEDKIEIFPILSRIPLI